MAEVATAPLTSETCAVCHESQLQHIVTACSKPDAPRGHEPLVCHPCFEQVMANAHARGQLWVPCPLCRSDIRMYKKVRADLLRSAEYDESASDVEVCTVRNFTDLFVYQPVPVLDASLPPPRQASTYALYYRHVLQAEDVSDATIRNVHRHVVDAGFTAFARHRIYNGTLSLLRTGASCTLCLEELLEHAAVLVNDEGICVSCLFPVHFHARRQ